MIFNRNFKQIYNVTANCFDRYINERRNAGNSVTFMMAGIRIENAELQGVQTSSYQCLIPCFPLAVYTYFNIISPTTINMDVGIIFLQIASPQLVHDG